MHGPSPSWETALVPGNGRRETPTREAAGPAPQLGESRARVLVALRSAGRPLSADELSQRVGLHSNTVRFHLEALVALRLVGGQVESRTAAGRPRTLYEASAESGQVGVRQYALLAQLLAESLARAVADGSDRAYAAGEEWGRSLATDSPERGGAQEGAARLLDSLEAMGCEPALSPEGRVITMHNCPFKDVADSHPDIVCSLHLGILRSVTEDLSVPQVVERLEPRLESGRCLIHLTDPPPAS